MADTTTAYSLMVADLGYTGTDIPAETKTLMEAKLAAALVQLAARASRSISPRRRTTSC